MKWSKTVSLAVGGVALLVLTLWALSLWKRPHDGPKPAESIPVTASDFWERGQGHRRDGEIDLALADMKKLIELDPAASRAWAVIAEILLEKEDFSGAEAAYGEVIRLKPKEAAALANRGVLRWQLKKKVEALSDLDQAVEANPQAIEARLTRAAIVQDGGKFADAIRDYDEILRLHPDHLDALVARGLAKQYSGNLDGAEKDLRDAEKLKEDRFDIQADLALLLKQKGDEKGSDAAFQKAIKIVPAQEARLRENLKNVPAFKK